MNQGNDTANKDFLTELMRSTGKEDLNYIYRGEFTQNLQQHILSLAEKNIDREKISGKIKKRVFHIMVESIQNISRHGDNKDNDDQENSAMFSIQKEKNWYYITTSNIIENSKVDSLRSKLDRINSMDQADLDKFYREVLGNGQLSKKGGAGLGLIEMVRKSGNKLSYDIEKINDEHSFFYLHSNINTTTLEEASTMMDKESIFSLNYMVKLHNFILSNSILLIYSAIFDQDSLLSLVSIMKNRIDNTASNKKKIVSLMVEMLQNIIHHGDKDINGCKGSQGIFYISEKKHKYYLTTINYIANDKKQPLKEK
ncbi:MAG: SiaB family protein kinase, partial [Bacteroidales bacterium]|nr:SiaB family protein kinase [Bacteroidales bacterium]